MSKINLKRVWEENKPHKDVLSGKMKDDIFAADLGDVWKGEAASIYQDPKEFFQKTFMTSSLNILLKNVSGRLSGKIPDADPIYKLETSFGGGKTHSLIALWHIATDKGKTEEVRKAIGGIKLPDKTRVVCIVGHKYNAAKGDKREEGLYVKTWWGDLAYQIGGLAAYNKIKENDEMRSSPGTELLGEIIGDIPTLILIDEPAEYFEKAAPISAGESTLARQTLPFFYEIMQVVSSKPNVVLVFTLASSKDAFTFWTQEVNQAIGEAESLGARKARVLEPTREKEVYGVVKSRLFESWNDKVGNEVVQVYHDMYTNTPDIPERFGGSEYYNEMKNSYPFHPELIDILSTRVASFSSFQRTRGTLRLLAKIIRNVWKRKEEDAYLIQPYHVDLSDPEIQSELTGRIGREAYKVVIAADVTNSKNTGKCQEMDKSYTGKLQPPVASRMGNTIFLNSLIHSDLKGVDESQLIFGSLVPGLNVSMLSSCLEKMEDKFWFLKNEGGRYYFDDEPTINKIIQDYMGTIAQPKVRERLTKQINHLYASGNLFTPIIQPDTSGVIPDNRDLKLIVIDYKAINIESKEDAIPKTIDEMWKYAGSQSKRTFRNTTFFIVAARDRLTRLDAVAKEYEALQALDANTNLKKDLSEEQRKKLDAKVNQSIQDLAIAVADAYRFLYLPQKEGPICVEFEPQTTGKVTTSRQNIIYERLKSENKVREELAADYVKSRAWPSQQEEMNTNMFRDIFYQQQSLPIPASIDVVKKIIRDGVQNKLWVYFKEKAYLSNQPIPSIEFSSDSILYTIPRAYELNLCDVNGDPCPKCKTWPCECKTEITEACPVCGQSPCICIRERPTKDGFCIGKGLAEIAISTLQRQIEEKKIITYNRLSLEVEGVNGDQALSTLLIHLPQGETTTIDYIATLQTGKGNTELRKFKIEAALSSEKYKKLRQGIHTFLGDNPIDLKTKIEMLWMTQKQDISTLEKPLEVLKKYTSIEFDIKLWGNVGE